MIEYFEKPLALVGGFLSLFGGRGCVIHRWDLKMGVILSCFCRLVKFIEFMRRRVLNNSTYHKKLL